MDTNRNDALAAHWAALEQQVADLTAQHGAPVAVNYQSGGYVAYATFLTDDRTRLLGYSLSSSGPAFLEWDAPAAHLGGDHGTYPFTDPDVWVDVLTIDDSAELHTVWADSPYGDYSLGYFTMHNTATGLTFVYGIGAAL